MRCLLVSVLRGAGLLLRRRSCSGPLLLLGVALCLFYQTRNRLRPRPQQPAQEAWTGRPAEEVLLEETRRFISTLEERQRDAAVQSESPPRQRAVVLTGRLSPSDTEVQLYRRVLQQLHYEVETSRYAETSSSLRPRQGAGGWSLLVCLPSAENSCLRRISFSHLRIHQQVNLLPELMEAFSDGGGGVCTFITRSQWTGPVLPMRPHSCGSTNQRQLVQEEGVNSHSANEDPPPDLVSMVNAYVLVTSLNPLISFMHDISVVMTNQEQRGRTIKLRDFLLQRFGPNTSHDALGQVKRVIGDVLQAAVSSNQKRGNPKRCVLCYQLMTFTLLLSSSITPKVVQVGMDVDVSALSDEDFEGQITKDLILEDALHFLSSSQPHLDAAGGQYGGCRGTVCMSEEDVLVLLQVHRQMKRRSTFQLLCPSSSSSPNSVSDLLIRIVHFHELQRNNSLGPKEPANQGLAVSWWDEGSCGHAHLRQIYMDPPLALTPPFSPTVKEYRAEVTFDTVTIRIRPEPVSAACQVHLDELRGPRMANYPVGLGHSRISILVTDETEPVVMAIYTVHVFRESRPSLPMFGDHVTCSFLQDCGLRLNTSLPCGLQPFTESPSPRRTCSSGHEPGQWVVPCLSCSDNRTCDWREVAWKPDGCHHPLVERPLLQDCMTDRKLMFIGDSTNRGMMYFLLERVNSTLADWDKAHDLLLYRNLNGGRSQVSYSYYPQFWLDKSLRPTFRQALLQLITRSRPLLNSNMTVLVVGGVQWLSAEHLRTVREVLHREALAQILVVVKSLGIGFHLPTDGIRSLSLVEIRRLYRENAAIIAAAKDCGYEAIDTFSMTMGRHREFLQGRCACHFHQVEKVQSSSHSEDSTWRTNRTMSTGTAPGLSSQSAVQDMDLEAWPKAWTYHVKGPVNQVYSEILLSRLCPRRE